MARIVTENDRNRNLITENDEGDYEMSAIREWINEFSILSDTSVNVDYLKEDVYQYSIDRTPSSLWVKKFVDGTGGLRQVTFDFSISLPLSSKALDNLVNSKFCEDFVEVVDRRNKNKDLPEIEGAFKIECTSEGYLLQKTATTAIYIIQLNFQYYKEI